jgi:subfamily B ATP-binding cassette protein MsbA
MALYKRILGFVRPFWKLVTLAVFLTFCYVFFNNLSLWVSVDFIREVFSPEQMSPVEQVVGTDMGQGGTVEGGEGGATARTGAGRTGDGSSAPADVVDDLLTGTSELDLYNRINLAIKRLIIRDDRRETLIVVCLVIFLSFLLKNVCFYLRRVIISFIQLNIILSIRNRLHSVMLRLPISFFEKRRTGELSSIMFNDVNAVNNVLNNSFGSLLLAPVQVLASLTILILISWKLSLITFVIVPLSGILIVKIGQSIRRKSRRVFQQISNVFSAFHEAITSIRIVKAFTGEPKEMKRFEEANKKYFRAEFRSKRLSYATSPLNETLGVSILVVLLWYGGNMVYSGTGMSGEDFIRYLVFLFTMFQPLKQLSGLNNIMQTGFAASERIFGIMDAEQEVYEKPGAIELEEFSESIEFKRVSFKYDGDEPVVLKNVDLTIPKGDTVALVGHSGSGKTTLASLLPRFHDVTSGEIRIDSVDVRDYTLNSLRKQMGIVTQDTILFNDTVKANIAYAMQNPDEEEIKKAAQAANAWEFIGEMEHGLDTVIGEKGLKLSGGQRQRVSIARAILKNPPILILDEATSSLDTEAEKIVQEAIEKLMKDRTVLVIAHRLSTVIHADKIVVMDRGEIVGTGPHQELLETCSTYRYLYEIQFRDEPDGHDETAGSDEPDGNDKTAGRDEPDRDDETASRDEPARDDKTAGRDEPTRRDGEEAESA